MENSHGDHQNALYKFRGKSKGPAAAAECSLLSSLVCEHTYLKSLILEETMPSRKSVAQLMRVLGRRKKGGKFTRPSGGRKARVLHAATKSKRRLSPWNVFQKSRLQELGVLTPEEFKQAMKEIGFEWSQKSKEGKSKYKVEAAYQQACRDELESRALASKPAPSHECLADAVPAKEQPTNVLEEIAGCLATNGWDQPIIYSFPFANPKRHPHGSSIAYSRWLSGLCFVLLLTDFSMMVPWYWFDDIAYYICSNQIIT